MEYHTNPRILLILLIVFAGGFIIIGFCALGEYANPLQHLWDLLVHDHVVQLIMFDFLFFFVWVFLWMIDRGKLRNRRMFPWLVVGIVAATLMIYIFILSERRPDAGEGKMS